jgi:tetratricopeptide (TPR) repeat protein
VDTRKKKKALLFLFSPFFWSVFVSIFLAATADAQDYQGTYKSAKALYAKEDYARAMSAFQPLIVYDSQNPYSEYASYYYGLSAYKSGFMIVAKDILVQTKKLYPKWDRLDDVNYLLAKIYFDEHEYFRALSLLKLIKSHVINLQADDMKRFYLSTIDDAETLKMVLEENPQEKEAARALVKTLGTVSGPRREEHLIDSLVHKFHFVKDELVSEVPLERIKKDRYSVSLMFPFQATTMDPSAGTKRNQFVLDLYEGMKMAADTLRHEKINLDLLAYDTEKNPDVLRKLLDSDELKSTDVIVGPLFTEESRQLLPFAEKNKISIINPVSSNSDFLGKNPSALLFEPSHETIGKAAAGIAAGNTRSKKCIVYYDTNPKDSVMAFNFIRKAKELGLKVILAQEIHTENSGDILATLATATDHDEYKNPIQFTLKRDSLGCIFVASEDPLIYSKVINAAETRGDSVLVIGNESWIAPENNTVDFSIFERVGVILSSPNYSSLTNPSYIAFRKNYIQKHGTLPSLYARTGYEFMLFLGRTLYKYGIYFQEDLARSGFIPGTLGLGSNYPGTRDNQIVPFIKFNDGQLIIADKK